MAIRCYVLVTLLWGLTGCGPAGLEVTEYQKGFNQGVRETREVRKDGGIATEYLIQSANYFGARPTDESKSADWNAGFQQGFKSELAK